MNSIDTNIIKSSDIKIGFKLQQARLSNHYTQDQVAEIIGCAPRYISSLERDKVRGSIPLILSLCNLYNIDLNTLYSEYLKSNISEHSSKLCGFYSLDEEHKKIIIKNISSLNEIEQEYKSK